MCCDTLCLHVVRRTYTQGKQHEAPHPTVRAGREDSAGLSVAGYVTGRYTTNGTATRAQLKGGTPAKETLEEQILGPHNAVNRLVWCIADGADRVGLGSLLWLALKAFCPASQVDCHLHGNLRSAFLHQTSLSMTNAVCMSAVTAGRHKYFTCHLGTNALWNSAYSTQGLGVDSAAMSAHTSVKRTEQIDCCCRHRLSELTGTPLSEN